MGAVYKAAMPVTGRIVALKVLKAAEIMEDLLGEEALREMFFKEAAAMALHQPRQRWPPSWTWTGAGMPRPPHFTMGVLLRQPRRAHGRDLRG